MLSSISLPHKPKLTAININSVPVPVPVPELAIISIASFYDLANLLCACVWLLDSVFVVKNFMSSHYDITELDLWFVWIEENEKKEFSGLWHSNGYN